MLDEIKVNFKASRRGLRIKEKIKGELKKTKPEN